MTWTRAQATLHEKTCNALRAGVSFSAVMGAHWLTMVVGAWSCLSTRMSGAGWSRSPAGVPGWRAPLHPQPSPAAMSPSKGGKGRHRRLPRASRGCPQALLRHWRISRDALVTG